MIWGDLFCGGGGTTTGAYGVPGVKVSWALNHSKTAIETHQANHPETKHYQADILVQDEHDLDEVDGIWMSSECTNHSIAKGGKLLDLGSRTLPMELVRFARHCKPTIIIVENVREFVNWGPLINGRPDKSKKGESFREWVSAVTELGYDNYEHRFINSADYGAYTSRTRYFGIFTKCGVPVQFPEPTHDKHGRNGLLKWNPCREKIDLSNYGQSIFAKNLCENTIKRIKAGLEKYGGDPFILSFYGSDGKVYNHPTSEPLPVITTKDRHALVQYIMKYGYGTKKPENNIESLDEPLSTLITTERHALISQFLTSYHSFSNEKDGERCNSLNNPVGVIDTSNRYALISQFISKSYNSDGHPERQNQSIEKPIGTITATNKMALVTQFLTSCYSTNKPSSMAHSVDEPIGTLTTSHAHMLITQFITRYQNSNGHPEANIQSIDDPISAMTTKEKHALISQLFGDIYFRFITIDEAKVLQGFPDNYKLIGSKADQLRHIGNSVVPIVAQKLIEANYMGHCLRRGDKSGHAGGEPDRGCGAQDILYESTNHAQKDAVGSPFNLLATP